MASNANKRSGPGRKSDPTPLDSGARCGNAIKPTGSPTSSVLLRNACVLDDTVKFRDVRLIRCGELLGRAADDFIAPFEDIAFDIGHGKNLDEFGMQLGQDLRRRSRGRIHSRSEEHTSELQS